MYKLESVTLAYWQTGVANSLIAVTNSAFNVSNQDCVQLVQATVSLFQTKKAWLQQLYERNKVAEDQPNKSS